MVRREPHTYRLVPRPRVNRRDSANEGMTNRATSVAAGVVSGAGFQNPVFQTPRWDESTSSRREGTTLHTERARQCASCLWPTGGAGANTQTERSDELNSFGEMTSRWGICPTGPAISGDRGQTQTLGDKGFGLAATSQRLLRFG